MTDQKLLELAAKAAGIDAHHPIGLGGGPYVRFSGPWAMRDTNDDVGALRKWNPLTDDGYALRLAVRCNLALHHFKDSCAVANDVQFFNELHATDPYAATRRAIVRAAAELGERMK